MSEDVPILGIPALRENPFKARPLERGQSNMLIGRDEISARWTRFLKARTARMVLLIGESGSGRSSLMRCVSEETGKSVHLDMFPTTEHAHKILHEIFVSLIGFDVPSSNQEMVSRLVSETERFEGPIPLISLDFSNVDGKHLSEVLSTLTAPLERLNSLVVVVLSTEQRAQWPNSLVNRFDHADVIQPLDLEQVRELCQTRIASASKISWDMPQLALEYVFDKTSGSPSKVMRLMRDMVDEERANPREIKYDEPTPEFTHSELEEDYITEEESNVEIDEDSEPIFDLDMEKLAQDPPDFIMAEPAQQTSPLPRGAFRALAARNRVSKEEAPPFDKSAAKKQSREPDGVDANHLWISDRPEAMLMQENQEVEDDDLDDFPTDDFQDHTELIHEHTENISQPAGDVEGLFTKLLDALNVPEGLGLAELLAAMRRPTIGQKESNALDVHTLRNLSKSEAVLVEVASNREFSPSDNRLQDRLNVGRPRMSQMSNRLYRAGILSVQQKGRTRMFKLTNDARAQLVAWGMMEVVV
jgi:hypothetical protein